MSLRIKNENLVVKGLKICYTSHNAYASPTIHTPALWLNPLSPPQVIYDHLFVWIQEVPERNTLLDKIFPKHPPSLSRGEKESEIQEDSHSKFEHFMAITLIYSTPSPMVGEPSQRPVP